MATNTVFESAELNSLENQQSPSYSQRDDEQREQLFDLVSATNFDLVRDLPLGARVAFERWHQRERTRLEPWLGRVVHAPASVEDLLDILAADTPDPQQAGRWLNKHRDEITAQLLAELVSAAMTRGVAESMRKRGNKRHEELRGKKADAIRLWETEYKHIPRMSKNKAAALIGGRVGLVEVTVRGYLTGL